MTTINQPALKYLVLCDLSQQLVQHRYTLLHCAIVFVLLQQSAVGEPRGEPGLPQHGVGTEAGG